MKIYLDYNVDPDTSVREYPGEGEAPIWAFLILGSAKTKMYGSKFSTFAR
jgi:hypothetical protein